MHGLGKPHVTPAVPKQQSMPAKGSCSCCSGGGEDASVRPDVAKTVQKLLMMPAKKVCLLSVSAGYLWIVCVKPH